ncbi:MAG: SurA N-terminal domain-containing protein [Paracoccaceae bacterium]|nr:MAG: SurA N-terminal domain-containing protein [Paracoccaceae bacterium]
MARPAPETTTPRKKKGGIANIFVWIMLVLLIVGLAGFSITNFGGGVTSVGRVGDRDLTVTDYANALRAEMSAFSAQVGQPVTFEMAQMLGLDRQVRQQLVTQAALDNEAARIGISAGDTRVAREIAEIPAFQGVNGQFDRETYRFTLERNDMTPAQFEVRLRDDLARSVLTGAVSGGFAAPDALTDTLFAWVAERRGFSLLRLTAADLADPLPDPTDADLTAHYEASIAAFTRPEARRIAYAALLPADLAPGMDLDEAALRRLYDERISEFVQPERRLVERLVLPDQATAEAAKARVDAGEPFETLVSERGLTLDDIDMGDVARADLGDAGEAVFALSEPGVVGPFATPLGPALFRMNGILAAQEITFDEAREDLSAELAADSARRAIADRREAIDDLLAGGASVAELAADEGLTAGTLDLVPGSEEPIAGYPAFREAAARLNPGDFPVLVDLDDGGLVALELTEILPPAPRPFDEVRDAVAESWRSAETARRLGDRAVAIKSEIEAGASLGAYGIVDVTARIARDGFVEEAPPALIEAVFQMQPDEVRVIEGPGFTALVRVDRIYPADPADPAVAPLHQAIAAQAEAALAQDAFALFSNGLTQGSGIQFNEGALNAVHAQMR